jgi:transposase
VFFDLIDKRVRFATPGKDKSTWEKFVEALGAHRSQPRAITEVSFDMILAYIARVNQGLPHSSTFVKTATMIERHLPGILTHWTHRTTNTFMESLNSAFSSMKRKARSFSSVDNFIAMLYFTSDHLHLTANHRKCQRAFRDLV